MKIIIVDDDCLVVGALKTILEVNEDVEVLATGADGKEACELYERYEPDVLLMDIRMEKMDGLEASRSILSRYPKANILLLTTFPMTIHSKSPASWCKGISPEAGLRQYSACTSGGLLWADSIWDRNSFQDSRPFAGRKEV